MTNPTAPPPRTGTPQPAPKPPMTDEELRLECARLAVQLSKSPALFTETATTVYNFVKSG